MTADGRFLYGSNRGHDSIVCFEISEGGNELQLVGFTSTYGAHPRNFGIHPSGRWLIVANQNSDNIVLFRLDPATGVLTREGDPIPVAGKPRCIKFRPASATAPAVAEASAPASGSSESASLIAAEEAAKSKQTWTLIGGFFVWMFGAQLTRTAQVELLLKHFHGDTVRLAAAFGTSSTRWYLRKPADR